MSMAAVGSAECDCDFRTASAQGLGSILNASPLGLRDWARLNTSFERGLNGWTVSTKGVNGTPVVVKDEHHWGFACVKFQQVNVAKGLPSAMIQSPLVRIAGGMAYKFSAWGKASGVSTAPKNYQTFYAVGRWYDAEKKQLAYYPDLSFGSGTYPWKRVTRTYKAPPEARYFAARIGLNGAVGTAWLDDVTFRPAPLSALKLPTP